MEFVFHPRSLTYGYVTNCLVSFKITYFMQNYFKLNKISLEQSEYDDGMVIVVVMVMWYVCVVLVGNFY